MKLFTRLYQKEAKETIWSFATKGVAAVLFILLNAFLARVLGTTTWGTWSYLLSILTIIYLVSYLGLNNAARAFAAQHNQTATLREVLRASLILRIAISAIFTTIFLLLHTQIAEWIGRPELTGPLRAAAPLVFLMGFSEYLKQVFTGVHRLKFHLVLNVIEFGGKLILSVLFLGAAATLDNVLLAFWLSVGVSVLVGFWFWLGFYNAPVENARVDYPSLTRPGDSFISEIFAYSLPLFLISVGFLLLTEIDTLMLGLLSTDIEVGQFAIAKQIANKLPQVALALSMGTMPGFARLTAENLEMMRIKFRNILRLNILIFVPGGMLLIFLSPWLIPWVFGSDYQPAVLPLQILTFWIVMTSFNMFFNALLDYQGRAKRRAKNFILTIALTIGFNLFLIPRYGAVGAAISTTVAFLPYMIFNIVEVREVFSEKK